MAVNDIVFWSDTVGALLGVGVVLLMFRTRNLALYWPLLPLSCWSLPSTLLFYWLGRYRYFPEVTSHHIFLVAYYAGYFLAAVASILITYKLLGDALSPFKGIQSLAVIMYRWVAAVALIASFGIVTTPGFDPANGTVVAVCQLVRVSSLLNLSLVAFLIFAIRPLGITRASRIVGVSAGIAITSLANLLQVSFASSHTMATRASLIGDIGQCFAELIWLYYFARPEPPRRFVLLAVSSPLHAWNQIAAVLGNKPSYAAIGGVPPEAFSPAELGMMASVPGGAVAAGPAASISREYFVNMDALNAASSIKIPEPGPDRIAKMRRERKEEE